MGRARRVVAAISAVVLSTAGGCLLAEPAAAATATATVSVNIRSGPGTGYPVIGGLIRGQHIDTLGPAQRGWIRVRFENTTAYVSADYLENSGRVAAPTRLQGGTRVTTATLNVRTGPGLAYRVVSMLRDGSAVTVTGRVSRGFAEAEVAGQRRWVSAQYLATSADPARARTIGRTATETLNVRAAPRESARRLGRVSAGDGVQATGATQNGYAQIRRGSGVAWVMARYLADADAVFPSAPAVTPVSASGNSAGSARRGQLALAFAKAQLGDRYVFGATGPNTWDCSGLVQAAWRAAGVRIPRTTYTQFTIGTRVSRSQLRAGDLVFFYGSNPSHVGIYVGDGMMINAPRPGRRVEYQRISAMPYAGAVRPG